MVVSSGNYFIELSLTQKTASKILICLFYFSPKGRFNVNDWVGRKTGTTLYNPLSLIIYIKYIVPNSMHCPVLQSCFTWKIW